MSTLDELTGDACAAMEAYETARRRATAEVGTEQYEGRRALSQERSAANAALTRLAIALPREGYRQIREIAEGITGGYSSSTWTLRVRTIVAPHVNARPA